jgi:methyl-accepting chemotaxis protein
VVASEVRSLAGRSAEAAKEIKGLISDSVQRVEQGTVLVDQAGTTMTEVVAAIRRVTDIMGEISAASTEQSQGVAQVGEAVTQMDQATQQNAALVEESAAAAESLKSQAQQLVQAVAVFKLAHGADTHAVVAPARTALAPQPSAKSFPAVERRGPTRSKNVTRLAAAKPAAAPRSEPATLSTPVETRKPAAGGGDDDWTTF